jgi:hypothetical protein
MTIFNSLNPGPTSPAPVQQPDYRVPTVSSNVASYPVGANVLNLTWPIPAYVQPGATSAVTGNIPPLGVVPA